MWKIDASSYDIFSQSESYRLAPLISGYQL
jgi:hypothetical protein